MMDDVNAVIEAFRTRVRNPLFGRLVLSWVLLHLHILAYIFIDGLGFAEAFDTMSGIEICFRNAGAVLMAVLWVWLGPIISYGIAYIQSEYISKERELRLKDEGKHLAQERRNEEHRLAIKEARDKQEAIKSDRLQESIKQLEDREILTEKHINDKGDKLKLLESREQDLRVKIDELSRIHSSVESEVMQYYSDPVIPQSDDRRIINYDGAEDGKKPFEYCIHITARLHEESINYESDDYSNNCKAAAIGIIDDESLESARVLARKIHIIAEAYYKHGLSLKFPAVEKIFDNYGDEIGLKEFRFIHEEMAKIAKKDVKTNFVICWLVMEYHRKRMSQSL